MEKKNVAIITGGNVAERGISLKSAKNIYSHLNDTLYNRYIIELNGSDFIDQQSKVIIDKNDFSLTLNGGKIKFDIAFLMIHGHPAEDGCLQGYLEIIGLPYTGSDAFVSALTFNKQACKIFLKNYNIAMAPSLLLKKEETIDWNILYEMSLPLIVKPNRNGSSYGISKVNKKEHLKSAIEFAFEYDNEVLVEGFMKGREFSNGVVRKDGEIVVLPVTEICFESEIFDYEAKYNGQSEEITPARLNNDQTRNCQEISKKLYEKLGCKGMARFDYILSEDSFMLIEANTIPGMSEMSIYPQQVVAHGWTVSELLDVMINEALS